MLQVPNAAAQLMAGPLFRRGTLCFEGGIGGDVLRHIFGPDDFFREQIKAERGKEVEVKRKIMWEAGSKSREKLTFESCVSLEGCSPGVACPCLWPWGFFLWRRGRR
jgi:hypothetical protein